MNTDTERLEWLVKGGGKRIAAYIMGNDTQGWAVADCSNGVTFASPRSCATFRDAIDAAMAKHPNGDGNG